MFQCIIIYMLGVCAIQSSTQHSRYVRVQLSCGQFFSILFNDGTNGLSACCAIKKLLGGSYLCINSLWSSPYSAIFDQNNSLEETLVGETSYNSMATNSGATNIDGDKPGGDKHQWRCLKKSFHRGNSILNSYESR